MNLLNLKESKSYQTLQSLPEDLRGRCYFIVIVRTISYLLSVIVAPICYFNHFPTTAIIVLNLLMLLLFLLTIRANNKLISLFRPLTIVGPIMTGVVHKIDDMFSLAVLLLCLLCIPLTHIFALNQFKEVETEAKSYEVDYSE